jgi:hypothetical protein
MTIYGLCLTAGIMSRFWRSLRRGHFIEAYTLAVFAFKSLNYGPREAL